MGPRKSQSPSSTCPSGDAKRKLPYTNEERTCLATLQTSLAKSAVKDIPSLSKESWAATVALLAGATEKLLKIAAENYETTLQATPNKENGPSTAPISSNSLTAVPSSLTGPAGSTTQFVDENTYLVDQMKLQPFCPFTIQRIVEILQDPFIQHVGVDGRLRGDALQASLRRCVLVTYPMPGMDEQ